MKPIYEPKGAAREYGELAVNLYTGCPHRCYYCFAPSVLRRDREAFHGTVEPRAGIVDAVKRQLDREGITGKLIHLCFTCDPYPKGGDTRTTREVIQAIKAAGNHVQILTKNPMGALDRDRDLLDAGDWFGTSFSCFPPRADEAEPGAENALNRLSALWAAKTFVGCKTWLSCEPVLVAEDIYRVIREFHSAYDKIKIGRLNYWPSDIDWGTFGRNVEWLCRRQGLDYVIKAGLRREMEGEA